MNCLGSTFDQEEEGSGGAIGTFSNVSSGSSDRFLVWMLVVGERNLSWCNLGGGLVTFFLRWYRRVRFLVRRVFLP